MSCITENTIVIQNQDVPFLHRAVDENQQKYGWVRNLKCVFNNASLSIFTFDCNGEAHSVDERVSYLIFETNYLDGDPLLTRIRDNKTNKVKNVRRRARYWITKLIGDEAYQRIYDDLVYSDGRI